MSYRPTDLSPGERLWLVRRRAGSTLLAQAATYGVTEWQYGEWERDRRPDVPWARLAPNRLTAGEQCALARRRADLNLRRVAALTGLSHVTVLKHETLDKVTALHQWWEQRGWPRTA